MHFVYLSLGSNLGSREKYISEAVNNIEKFIGTISRNSSLYETEPWGTDHPQIFLNKVVVIETNLTVAMVFEKIQIIEKSIGRIRTAEKYSPRTIDIDILFIDEIILNDKNLTIPHPLLHERKFVLEPLAEIAGEFVHPVIKKSIQQILDECKDEHQVKKIS